MDLVAGVVGKAGPVDLLHPGLAAQELGHHLAVLLVPGHAQGERLGAAQDQPRIEGRQDGARRVLVVLQPLGVVGIPDHRHPAHAVGVPVQELRRGVDHHVRTEGQRPLEEGAHERVVHHQQRPLPAGDRGQGGDVADLHQRVGRGLDP